MVKLVREPVQQQRPEIISPSSWLQGFASSAVIDADRNPRLHELFDNYCDQLGNRMARRRVAIEETDKSYSFSELSLYSNQIARQLLSCGVHVDANVGLLFDRSIASFASVLAISRLDATYVPLDAAFPRDRIRYIIEDSDITHVVTLSEYEHLFNDTGVVVIGVDSLAQQIKARSGKRLVSPDRGRIDPVCYVIYTSGSTGRPKGVPIRHSSICNFLSIASEHYGYRDDDRVYHGMTIAFDFSFEETWVPLLSGATLVVAPSNVRLLGDDLASFIKANRITALCCVPTLLATLDDDLPGLRFLMVSGEGCPQDLADRWNRSGRRFINTYGPTEATVSATWAVMKPGEKVSIGRPLPSYSIGIISVTDHRLLPAGQTGEICIGGVGLSDGYLNLPDRTAESFIVIDAGPREISSVPVYRTGDLGRINAEGKLECLGRIDHQVKIRGYRIELDEIESVARTVDGVGQVVVNPVTSDDGQVELVAYYTEKSAGLCDPSILHRVLTERLPAYMIPSYFEPLDTLPLLPGSKIDRNALPAPRTQRYLVSGKRYRAPEGDYERSLAKILCALLKVDRVSADSHIFDDLGANSLLIARYLTAISKTLPVRKLSMKAVYQHPSIEQLAQLLSQDNDECDGQLKRSHRTAVNSDNHNFMHASLNETKNPVRVASTREYLFCGFLNVLFFATMAAISAIYVTALFTWIQSAGTTIDQWVRALIGVCNGFVLTSLGLVALKWLATGRFTSTPVEIWSKDYVRFWIAKQAIQMNPMNLFTGTPLYNHYLRTLGVKVGKGAVVLSRPPVCTDLISIGSQAVVRRDSFFTGYRACGGYIHCGPITIKDRALIGEAAVLDIDTVVGVESQLGNSSALYSGQTVPDRSIYHGSPARPTETDYQRVASMKSHPYKGWRYAVLQLFASLFAGALIIVAGITVFDSSSSGSNFFSKNQSLLASALNILGYSGLLYFGGLLLAMATIVTVPRLINLFIREDVTYPLYGWHHYLTQTLTRVSNSTVLNTLFGDSSMIVHYLRAVGYDLRHSTQTGSNFGVSQRHYSPFLCQFSRNTLVSDGLMIVNMEVSSTAFQLSRVSVAADNYLGNLLHFPAGAKVGENCLIGTKTMIPIDGPVRKNVGLLGSPPFEIPRSVVRDRKFDHFKKPEILKQRLRKKLASNLITLGLYLFRNWLQAALVLGLFVFTFATASAQIASEFIALAMTIALVFTCSLFLLPLFSIMFERIVLVLYPLKPLYCSLYDRQFWNHERFWKLNYNALLVVFAGTPIRSFFLRLQGVRLGKQVFDDGVAITEPTLVTIGDNCSFNTGSSIQCHSLEDGTFKSDTIEIGADCTLDMRAFVHYGCHIKNGSTIKADSFVMKGTVVEENELWYGNPACVRQESAALAKQASTNKVDQRSGERNKVQGENMAGLQVEEAVQ